MLNNIILLVKKYNLSYVPNGNMEHVQKLIFVKQA